MLRTKTAELQCQRVPWECPYTPGAHATELTPEVLIASKEDVLGLLHSHGSQYGMFCLVAYL